MHPVGSWKKRTRSWRRDYEAIRRREYELITNLLEVIPRIDGLGEEQVTQMRDALFHADHPYMMVFVGPFSAGKSSLINALLGEHDLLSIGPTPTTDRISILRWGEEPSRNRSGEVDTVFYPSPLLQKVSFVDTPGLESVFQKHEDITRRFLHRSDTVLLVMLATQAMTARNVEYLQAAQGLRQERDHHPQPGRSADAGRNRNGAGLRPRPEPPAVGLQAGNLADLGEDRDRARGCRTARSTRNCGKPAG